MRFCSSHLDLFTSFAERADVAQLERFKCDEFQLGAALELVVWRLGRADNCSKEFRDLVDSWIQSNRMLRALLDSYQGEGSPGASRAFLVDSRGCLRSLEFATFIDRFQQAVTGAGISTKLAQGLCGAFSDMADNIVQHSGSDGASSASTVRGIAAWSVLGRTVSYSLGDMGVGALVSLRRNEKWNSLTTQKAAIEAIATKGASSRTDQGSGKGYRDLFAALVSFDGVLRIRSGTGRFQLEGSLGSSQGLGGVTTEQPGLQISVECKI